MCCWIDGKRSEAEQRIGDFFKSFDWDLLRYRVQTLSRGDDYDPPDSPNNFFESCLGASIFFSIIFSKIMEKSKKSKNSGRWSRSACSCIYSTIRSEFQVLPCPGELWWRYANETESRMEEWRVDPFCSRAQKKPSMDERWALIWDDSFSRNTPWLRLTLSTPVVAELHTQLANSDFPS